MKFLRNILDQQAKLFEKGGKLEWLYPVWEANDTFLFTSGQVTKTSAHVRDALDLKRIMITVVVALIPCTLMALYNTGYQANIAMAQLGMETPEGWRHAIIGALGIGYNPGNILACLLHGALYFLPVYIVTLAVGGFWEVLFAVVRKHEINEGFLVTSLLFPLILPPTIPLWQVAFGITFGIVIGKEIFGGVGMNVLNPALTARAFLYFAYPAQISGDTVWVAADGVSGATAMSLAKDGGATLVIENGFTWMQSFVGLIPGSMGETSALACLFGAVVLIVTGIGSWRTMAGVFGGAILTIIVLGLLGPAESPVFHIPVHWHLVMGGLAFGGVFMATDPVSSPFTETGKLIYGFGIGFLAILMRVLNPAYPETVMLAILFMNVFAPVIDYFIMQANIKRRVARHAA